MLTYAYVRVHVPKFVIIIHIYTYAFMPVACGGILIQGITFTESVFLLVYIFFIYVTNGNNFMGLVRHIYRLR